MSEKANLAAPEQAVASIGGRAKQVPPGSDMYLLHDMREAELTAEALLDLLRRRGALDGWDGGDSPSLVSVIQSLRDLDARLFMPREHESG